MNPIISTYGGGWTAARTGSFGIGLAAMVLVGSNCGLTSNYPEGRNDRLGREYRYAGKLNVTRRENEGRSENITPLALPSPSEELGVIREALSLSTTELANLLGCLAKRFTTGEQVNQSVTRTKVD